MHPSRTQCWPSHWQSPEQGEIACKACDLRVPEYFWAAHCRGPYHRRMQLEHTGKKLKTEEAGWSASGTETVPYGHFSCYAAISAQCVRMQREERETSHRARKKWKAGVVETLNFF